MPSFTVEIDTGNAAFHRDADGTYDPGPELVRILRKVADELLCNGVQAGDWLPLRDVNGNTVGRFALGAGTPIREKLVGGDPDLFCAHDDKQRGERGLANGFCGHCGARRPLDHDHD